MAHFPVRSLEPLATKYDLGAVLSVHKQEKAGIRRLSRRVWSFAAAAPVGVALAVWSETDYNYSTPESIGIVVLILGLYAAGLYFAGPLGASMYPPDGEARWIVRYEHGLIDAREPTEDESDAEHDVDIIGKVVRLEQIVELEYGGEIGTFDGPEPGWTGSPPATHPAKARIVADRDGRRTTLRLHGFRHQERLLSELRLQLLRLQSA